MTRHLPPQQTTHIAGVDGIQLQLRAWRAEAPLGTVVVVHGFAEHGLRYGGLVDALVARQWNVLTYDHRGHGHSGGTRVFVTRFAEYTEDLARMVAWAQAELGGPVVLFGHSMGGLITLRTLLDRPMLAAAAVLSNPALANKVVVPAWKEWLGQGASKLWPTLAIPSGIPPEHVSRDPEMVRDYAHDPLVSKQATARWYTEFCQAQAEVLAAPDKLRELPMLALIGESDLIADPGPNKAFFGKTGPRTQLSVYPGFYHELLNEPPADRDRVLADIGHWLSSLEAGTSNRAAGTSR
jgi:alpha-beta hydrolase superfamily lysophospholipase